MIRLFSLLIIYISATFFYTTDTYAKKENSNIAFTKEDGHRFSKEKEIT